MRRRGSLVLGYHTLSRTWDNSVAVRPSDFRAQLALLREAGYRSGTFSEAVQHPDQPIVAITFDDAFLAVHEAALPLLDEVDMIATLFAPTRFPGSGEPLLWDGYDGPEAGSEQDRASLSWEHLRELAARGWEIGSHTRTHPHLPDLDDAELQEELSASREECAAGTGRPCTTLAYPYGEVDRRVRNAAQEAGYLAAAALGPQWRRGDPLWWPRVGIYRDDDLERFRLKLRGLLRSRAFAAGVTGTRRLAGLRA